jgi:protein phosphatase
MTIAQIDNTPNLSLPAPSPKPFESGVEPNPWDSENLILTEDHNPQDSIAVPLTAPSSNLDENIWDAPIDLEPIANSTPPAIDLNMAPNPADPAIVPPDPTQILPAIKSDLEPSPWGDLEPAQIATEETSNKQNDPISVPLVPTVYLDPQSRYRLIDPVVIQLITSRDSSQVRVIDRQPFRSSPVETLMKEDPIEPDPNTPNTSAVAEAAPRSPEDYQQWQSWNDLDVPKITRAYIALRASLAGTIPPIKDGWNEDGKTITLVEDRSDWTRLLDRWNDPQISSSQIIYWLDRTLQLWVVLEPWKMRQSLLEINNLLLDEDATICLQRLCREPSLKSTSDKNQPLKLADLAKLWRSLFERSGVIASPALASSIAAMESGELERIEEIRSRLQQIAYELEPKCLSAPLMTGASESLTTGSDDAPTIALTRKLIDLTDAAATHTGKKRDHNEDCFGIVSQIDRTYSPKGRTVTARGLYILCDGMGGHAGGEIASAMTVDLLREYFASNWGDTLPDEETIREGIIQTNEAVFDLNQRNAASGNGRMGTTLVLVLVQNRDIAIAHVGDSRCYAITPSQGSIQLTIDHEVGQQQIMRGVEPEIAYGRPDSYQLTQAIGPRDRNYIAPDIKFFELQEDTLILLASDGLTDNQLVETYWLTNVAPLLAPHTDLQDGVDRLIDFANDYNGHDNITALLVRARLA